MHLADEVTFEIYFEKIGEIKFQSNHSEFFFRKVPKNDDRNRATVSCEKSRCSVFFQQKNIAFSSMGLFHVKIQ